MNVSKNNLDHITHQRWLLFMVFFSIIMTFLPENTEAQCAMCRASVKSNLQADGRHIGAGLNQGILYLMIMPYILLSVIGYSWYKSSRNNQTKRNYQVIVKN